jgi:type III protein arginine methyltransferase
LLYDQVAQSRLDVSALKRLGESYEAIGDQDVAVRTWVQSGADAYYRQANDWQRLALINAFKVQQDPAAVAAHAELGIARYHLGEFTAAVAPLRQVLTLDSQNLVAHFYLAMTYLRLNEWEKAVPVFAWVVDAIPAVGFQGVSDFDTTLRNDMYHDAVFGLAYCYKVLGQHELAQQWYAQAQRLWPSEPTSYGHLVDIFLNQNRPELALQQIKALIATGRANVVDYAFRAGLIYLALNQPEQARDYFMQAIAAEPERALIYVWLGDALCRLAQPAAAEDAYQRAMALGQEVTSTTCP